MEGGATEEMLISSVAIKQAFDRLGMIDDDRERTINMSSKLYWAIGADGGNKGRAIEMIAYCVWDEKLGKRKRSLPEPKPTNVKWVGQAPELPVSGGAESTSTELESQQSTQL